MPPRSVCLNVFTTSLGNGPLSKESDVVVREMTGRTGEGAVEERARHDSVQEDSISTNKTLSHAFNTTTTSSPIASATINVATLPADSRGTANPFFSTILPTTCSTCTRPPPSGHSLLRCSRCKRAYYCSRTCQKQAWKTHKADCDPASAASPSSALDTPDVSMPGSPATVTDETRFNLTAPITRDVASPCGAISDAVYGASTAAQ